MTLADVNDELAPERVDLVHLEEFEKSRRDEEVDKWTL